MLMVDLVINDRRREARRTVPAQGHGLEPQVPGSPVLQVVDASPHGLRCLLSKAVRPGRCMPLRLPSRGRLVVQSAFVVRCVVSRLSRHGVQFDAAWTIDGRWDHEY
jgi:hypothetical protein